MSKNTPGSIGTVKKKWREKNPPDKDGNYICWICKKPVHYTQLSLDHVAPVELYPEYSTNLSNLRPSHALCNQQRAVPHHSKLLTRFGSHHRRTRLVR